MIYYMILLGLLFLFLGYGVYITHKYSALQRNHSILNDTHDRYVKLYKYSDSDVEWAIKYVVRGQIVNYQYHDNEQVIRIRNLIKILNAEIYSVNEILLKKLIENGKKVFDEIEFVKFLQEKQTMLNKIATYSNSEKFLTDIVTRINEKQLR